jgi:hypothetical protein
MQKRARRRFRRRVAVFSGAFILAMLLLQRCGCGPLPPPVSGPSKDAGVASAPPDAGFRVKAVPLKAPHLGKQQRGTLTVDLSASPPWLEELRLQVAARSPRLADCFRGADKPGALRWTTGVNPENGAVFDPDFELIGDTMWQLGQRECITRVLSNPRYRFQHLPPPSATPPRVSLMLEF